MTPNILAPPKVERRKLKTNKQSAVSGYFPEISPHPSFPKRGI
jgi:hypothetical protein